MEKMQTLNECILTYRRTLRELLEKKGVRTNPGMTDEQILDHVSRLLRDTPPVISNDLVAAVTDFFARNVYKGYVLPFKLSSIKRFSGDPTIVMAVPQGIEEEIDRDQDPEWEKGLTELGRKFNVDLRLPYWCYGK